MKEKIIGILGGMGPEATIDLFQKIVKLTPAKQDQDHIRIIIDNNPKIPDRTKSIIGTETNPLPELVKTANNLERAGVDFIIIPCNTAHFFYQDIQKEVNIPILNMIKETADYINQTLPEINRVCLFATKGTYKAGLYQTFLEEIKVETLMPTKNEQEQIMSMIYNIKSGYSLEKLKIQIKELAISYINKGAEGIITGCTELPLILEEGDIPIPVIDPTKILALKAIKLAINK